MAANPYIQVKQEQIDEMRRLQKAVPDLKVAIATYIKAGIPVEDLTHELAAAEERIKKFLNVFGNTTVQL